MRRDGPGAPPRRPDRRHRAALVPGADLLGAVRRVPQRRGRPHPHLHARANCEAKIKSAGLQPAGTTTRTPCTPRTGGSSARSASTTTRHPPCRGVPQAAGLGHHEEAPRHPGRRARAQPADRQELRGLRDQARLTVGAAGWTRRDLSRAPGSSVLPEGIAAQAAHLRHAQGADGAIPWFPRPPPRPRGTTPRPPMALAPRASTRPPSAPTTGWPGTRTRTAPGTAYADGDGEVADRGAGDQLRRLPRRRRLAPLPGHRRRRVPRPACGPPSCAADRFRARPAAAGAARSAGSATPTARPATDALLTGLLLASTMRCAARSPSPNSLDEPSRTGSWRLPASATRSADTERFLDKHRYSMDWYYPVLGGALRGAEAETRIEERWDTFVVPGLGVRCVCDQPWVTGRRHPNWCSPWQRSAAGPRC